MPDRRTFTDSGQCWEDFAAHCLVRCPRCSECADVRAIDEKSLFGEWRLICTHCGLARSESGFNAMSPSGERTRGDTHKPLVGGNGMPPIDPAFGLPLWLQTNCRGHTLWAFNPNHLTLIEQYVAADVRARVPQQCKDGPRNSTIVSRLPKWIVEASAREDVLGAIARLRQSLRGAA